MKIFLIVVLLLVASILTSVGSCIASIYNTAKATPDILSYGNIKPVKDEFGSIVDYTVGNLSLVNDSICAENLGGRYFMYKLYNENPTERVIFYLDEYQVNKEYYIYTKEGNCLWWHRKDYRIGCE